MKTLSLFRLSLLDQVRSLSHPFFSLGALQILDALDQPENGQRSLLIAHPVLKIGNQAPSPLRQFVLFLGNEYSRVRGFGLNGAPSQGRLDLRQHPGFPCVYFLRRINGPEQDQAA